MFHYLCAIYYLLYIWWKNNDNSIFEENKWHLQYRPARLIKSVNWIRMNERWWMKEKNLRSKKNAENFNPTKETTKFRMWTNDETNAIYKIHIDVNQMKKRTDKKFWFLIFTFRVKHTSNIFATADENHDDHQ